VIHRSFARAVAAVLLALSLSACGIAIDTSRVTPQGTIANSAATADASRQAVKDVIQRSNEAQATAVNTGDATAMRANVTAGYYAELLRINRDLTASGVTKIELLSTDWGDISVDGKSAKATTLETWRSTYQDGSSDEQTARNDYTLVLEGGAWKVDADEQPAAVLRPAPQQPDTGTPTAATAFSTSSNWSGYAATGGTFTSVTATWTVPNVSAATPGADATWVGIGGVSGDDLIQAGTQATVSGGQVVYDAWIEMLPASSKPVSLSVNAGDSVTVSITQKSALEWSIAIKNNSTGNRYATTVQYRSSMSSAEWVQEAPSAGRGIVPLDAFGTLTFTGASAVKDGKTYDLRGLGEQAITMINGDRQALATPSVIGDDGASFSVTRTDVPSTQTGTQRRRRG
jgi:hypothetical protein